LKRGDTDIGRILTARRGDRHISANFLEVYITQPGLSSSAESDPKGHRDAFLGYVQYNLVLLPACCPSYWPIEHSIETEGFPVHAESMERRA